MIGTFILNICLHQEFMLSQKIHDYKKYIGLIVEITSSIYFMYDSYYK